MGQVFTPFLPPCLLVLCLNVSLHASELVPPAARHPPLHPPYLADTYRGVPSPGCSVLLSGDFRRESRWPGFRSSALAHEFCDVHRPLRLALGLLCFSSRPARLPLTGHLAWPFPLTRRVSGWGEGGQRQAFKRRGGWGCVCVWRATMWQRPGTGALRSHVPRGEGMGGRASTPKAGKQSVGWISALALSIFPGGKTGQRCHTERRSGKAELEPQVCRPCWPAGDGGGDGSEKQGGPPQRGWR